MNVRMKLVEIAKSEDVEGYVAPGQAPAGMTEGQRRAHNERVMKAAMAAGRAVSKAVREFMPGGGRLNEVTPDAVATALDRMSGTGTTEEPDADRRGPADPFLSPTGGHGQPPLKGYEIVGDAWLAGDEPRTPNFVMDRVGGAVVATPADFRAPQPGARLGDSHVLVNRREGFWRGTGAHVALSKSEQEYVEKREGPGAADEWPQGPSRWRRE